MGCFEHRGEDLQWGVEGMRGAGSIVQAVGDGVELSLGVHRQIGALGEVLPQQSIAVLRRTRRRNQGCVHQCSSLERQALSGQDGVDRIENHRCQFVLIKQMTEARNGGFVLYPACARQPSKLPVQRPLVKLSCHRRVAQVPSQLQAVNAQHHFHRKRRATAQSLVGSACRRRDQRHQFRPWHDVVHFVEEDLLVGLSRYQSG